MKPLRKAILESLTRVEMKVNKDNACLFVHITFSAPEVIVTVSMQLSNLTVIVQSDCYTLYSVNHYIRELGALSCAKLELP